MWLLLLASIVPKLSSAEIPSTFNCKGRAIGYYAHIGSGCHQYHLCSDGGKLWTYSCPKGTLFQQRMLVCDHEHNVICSDSAHYFYLNNIQDKTHRPEERAPEVERVHQKTNFGTSDYSTVGYKHSTVFSQNTENVNSYATFNALPPVVKKQTTIYVTVSPIFDITSPDNVSADINSSPIDSLKFERALEEKLNNIQSVAKETRKQLEWTLPTRLNDQVQHRQSEGLDTDESAEQMEYKLLRERLDNFNASRKDGKLPHALDHTFQERAGKDLDNSKEREDKRQELEETRRRLEWTLPDVRAMLYVPSDPSEAVQPNIKRYSITLPSKRHTPQMAFRTAQESRLKCPQQCDARFFRPGTCTPCLRLA